MSLENKTVFMTGGTGGIGRCLVPLLEQQGARVTLYKRDVHGDLSNMSEQLDHTLKDLAPDILINMAGVNYPGFCEDQDMDTILAVNLYAPIRLTQAVLPAMKARNSGQIVNVGSMIGLIPLPHVTGYAAAKAGLKAFNDALRRELGGTGIRLTHIVPRAVATPMNEGLQDEINRRSGVTADDPEKVAKLIVQAIADQKTEIRIGWPERFFAVLNGLFPALVDQGLTKAHRAGEEVLSHHSTDRPMSKLSPDTIWKG